MLLSLWLDALKNIFLLDRALWQVYGAQNHFGAGDDTLTLQYRKDGLTHKSAIPRCPQGKYARSRMRAANTSFP